MKLYTITADNINVEHLFVKIKTTDNLLSGNMYCYTHYSIYYTAKILDIQLNRINKTQETKSNRI